MREALALLLLSPVLFAGPILNMRPHLPDFYQHQLGPNAVNVENDAAMNFFMAEALNRATPAYNQTPLWWENGGGWCCVAAHVNSFYYLEKQYGYDGLFTRTGGELQPWLNQMTYAIEDMAKTYLFDGREIAEHVRDLEKQSADKLTKAGKTPKASLIYKEFTVGGTGVELGVADASGKNLIAKPTTYKNLFEAYHGELCAKEDVEIRLVPNTLTGPWWAGPGGFHVVTGAGVGDCTDATKMSIAFADPDKRNKFDAANKKYLDEDTRSRYDAGLPLPVGSIHYEVVEVDANGVITDGLYKGAKIEKITSISPTPEPSTWLLTGLAIAALTARRWPIKR